MAVCFPYEASMWVGRNFLNRAGLLDPASNFLLPRWATYGHVGISLACSPNLHVYFMSLATGQPFLHLQCHRISRHSTAQRFPNTERYVAGKTSGAFLRSESFSFAVTNLGGQPPWKL